MDPAVRLSHLTKYSYALLTQCKRKVLLC